MVLLLTVFYHIDKKQVINTEVSSFIICLSVLFLYIQMNCNLYLENIHIFLLFALLFLITKIQTPQYLSDKL